MITAKQEEINNRELDEYQKLIDDQKARFAEFMQFQVDSGTIYKCSETSADEWLETPERTAKLIIEL